MLGVYSKPTDVDKVSQSVCNVLIDGKPTFAFECRSTEGKESRAAIGQVQLEKGNYEISLEHTKPGIEIKFVALSRDVSVSSEIDYLKSE